MHGKTVAECGMENQMTEDRRDQFGVASEECKLFNAECSPVRRPPR